MAVDKKKRLILPNPPLEGAKKDVMDKASLKKHRESLLVSRKQSRIEREDERKRELAKVSPSVSDAIAALHDADYNSVSDLEIANMISDLGGFATITGTISEGTLLVRQRCEIVDSETMRNQLIRRKADVSYISQDVLSNLVQQGRIKMGRANYPEDPAFYCTFAYGLFSGGRKDASTVNARVVCFTESHKGLFDSQFIATGFWRVKKPLPFLAILEKNDPDRKELFRHPFVKAAVPPSELNGSVIASTEYLAEIFAQDVPKGSEVKYRPSAFFSRMSFANGIKSIAYSSVKAKEINREGNIFPFIVNLVMPSEVADEYLALEKVSLTEMAKVSEKQYGDLYTDSYLATPVNSSSFQDGEEFNWELQPKPSSWTRV